MFPAGRAPWLPARPCAASCRLSSKAPSKEPLPHTWATRRPASRPKNSSASPPSSAKHARKEKGHDRCTFRVPDRRVPNPRGHLAQRHDRTTDGVRRGVGPAPGFGGDTTPRLVRGHAELAGLAGAVAYLAALEGSVGLAVDAHGYAGERHAGNCAAQGPDRRIACVRTVWFGGCIFGACALGLHASGTAHPGPGSK